MNVPPVPVEATCTLADRKLVQSVPVAPDGSDRMLLTMAVCAAAPVRVSTAHCVYSRPFASTLRVARSPSADTPDVTVSRLTTPAIVSLSPDTWAVSSSYCVPPPTASSAPVESYSVTLICRLASIPITPTSPESTVSDVTNPIIGVPLPEPAVNAASSVDAVPPDPAPALMLTLR